MTKKQIRLLLSIIVLLLVYIFGQEAFVNDVANNEPDEQAINTPDGNEPDEPVIVPDGYVRVLRVIDGDTIAVDMSGESKTIRFIGINTPESVDPRRGVECFGDEASTYLKNVLEGKNVRLVIDQTQDEVDRYGRLLRVVYLDDNTDVNEKMIRDGYAYEYTYEKPYERQSAYKAAEEEARNMQKGLWSRDTCNGER